MQQFDKCLLRFFMQSQSGADGHGVDAAVPFDVGMIVGAVVGLALRFRQAQLHDFVTTTGYTYGKQTYATAHACPGSQQRSAHHAATACNEQGIAEIVLVAERLAWVKQLAQVFFGDNSCHVVRFL